MKKMKFFAFATFFFILSCSNNSEDDLTNPIVVGHTKYSTDVKPIVDSKCIICHAATPLNGAPMPLITLAQVKEAIENRNLIGKISRPDGALGLMPYGGPRLPQTSIDIIVDWKASGFLE